MTPDDLMLTVVAFGILVAIVAVARLGSPDRAPYRSTPCNHERPAGLERGGLHECAGCGQIIDHWAGQ